jgi:uncharacterized radical SAM superfamily Fe-S cluster-containing enzyme
LCTDHEQHSCLTLLEVCDACNLRCPVCYASSGPDRSEFRTLVEIEKMLDAVVRNEGSPDVVQIPVASPPCILISFEYSTSRKRGRSAI